MDRFTVEYKALRSKHPSRLFSYTQDRLSASVLLAANNSEKELFVFQFNKLGAKQRGKTHSEGGSSSVLICICIYSFFSLFSPSSAKNRINHLT